jgi:GxxExxY protein
LIADFATAFGPIHDFPVNSRGTPNAPRGVWTMTPLSASKSSAAQLMSTGTSARGFLESAYHTALCVELAHRGLSFDRKRIVPLQYRGIRIGDYIPDLIVANTVVVEIKSVLRFEDVFTSQMLTYLRITGLRVGLIINFNKRLLRDGIKRVVF